MRAKTHKRAAPPVVVLDVATSLGGAGAQASAPSVSPAAPAVDVSAVLQKYVNTKGRGCELLLPT